MIFRLISEGHQCTFHSLSQVMTVVCFKSESRTLFGFPVEFVYGVFQTTCLECNYGSTSNKELMLHNTSRLESRWHETKVSSSVYEWTISEKFIWSSPEAVREFVLEVPHAMSATSCILISMLSWTSYEDLNLLIKLVNKLLSCFED